MGVGTDMLRFSPWSLVFEAGSWIACAEGALRTAERAVLESMERYVVEKKAGDEVRFDAPRRVRSGVKRIASLDIS